MEYCEGIWCSGVSCGNVPRCGGETRRKGRAARAITAMGTKDEIVSSGSIGSVDRGEGPGDTLRGFLKRGEVFIEEILKENEALRLRGVQLESRLHEAATPIPAPVAAEELRSIFEELHREHEQLSRRLDEVALETESYKVRYQQIEEENDRLVNLFVSAHQLHSSLELGEVVQIIVEILLNFVGAGRFALLVKDEPSGVFHAIESYGMPLSEVPELSPDSPVLGTCLREGRAVVAQGPGQGWDRHQPRVCLPLRLGAEVTALAVVYSFLEQKEHLSDIDLELFNLLSDHGGVVLESALLAAAAPPVTSRLAACRSLLASGERNHA